jgi:hypothetical protein
MTIHTMKYEDKDGDKVTISFDGTKTSIDSIEGHFLTVPHILPTTLEKWLTGVLNKLNDKVLISYKTITIGKGA